MANEFVAKNGLISQNNTTVSGSLTVTQGITGSLFGTSSWAYSASQALTASYINTLYSSNFTASFGLSTTWTINHNLNTRYVIVQTFDSNHNQLLPQDITLTNTNTVTATFSAAEAGYAVVTVGGALLNNATPGGNTSTVQYNAGGAFSGSDIFQFDGSNFILYDNIQTRKALDTVQSSYYNFTEILNYRRIDTSYITDFANSENHAGDIIGGTITGASSWDLVYLDTDAIWKPVDQSNAKATRMLGIYNGSRVLTEGYLVVGDADVVNPSSYTLIAGTLSPGAPVYISGSATSAPFLSTTIPTSGIVRILGHLIQQENTDYWFMRFRPDHTWVTI
jgi:hypothetical protein